MEKIIDVIDNDFVETVVNLCNDLLVPTRRIRISFGTKPEETFGGISVSYECGENNELVCVFHVEKALVYGKYYKQMEYRLFSFVESNGIPLTRYTRTLILLLHEFGHVEYVGILDDYDCIPINNAIVENAKNIFEFAFTKSDINEHIEDGLDITYFLRGDEMFADAFALRHFLRIYTILESRNLIPNE